MSSRPLEPFCCAFQNGTTLPLTFRFTNVDTKSCRFMMVERRDGVKSIATKVRNSWFYWITGEIEWIECVVDPGATMRMHCDASSQLKCTMRVFMPDTLHFVSSRETEYVLHFKHDDDTYVYKYNVHLSTVRYVTERRCPSTTPTAFKQLFFKTQLIQGNSPHDGLEISNLGSHILSKDSSMWNEFLVPGLEESGLHRTSIRPFRGGNRLPVAAKAHEQAAADAVEADVPVPFVRSE